MIKKKNKKKSFYEGRILLYIVKLASLGYWTQVKYSNLLSEENVYFKTNQVGVYRIFIDRTITFVRYFSPEWLDIHTKSVNIIHIYKYIYIYYDSVVELFLLVSIYKIKPTH